MKRIVVSGVFIWLLVMAAPMLAQDTKDCGTDSLKAQMNELLANYSAAQAEATDAAGVVAAATELQTRIAALTASCAGVEAEATAELASAVTPLDGRWMLVWQEKSLSCPAENYAVTLQDYPVFLKMNSDGSGLTINDLFWYGEVAFKAGQAGHFVYRRDATVQGKAHDYTYLLSPDKSDLITGTLTDIASGSTCEQLVRHFTLTRVAAKVICMVGTPTGANLRSGPGTSFDRVGTLKAAVPVDVAGYAVGQDGAKWWKMVGGGWVRSDLVKAAGYCDTVPEVKGS